MEREATLEIESMVTNTLKINPDINSNYTKISNPFYMLIGLLKGLLFYVL